MQFLEGPGPVLSFGDSRVEGLRTLRIINKKDKNKKNGFLRSGKQEATHESRFLSSLFGLIYLSIKNSQSFQEAP